MHFDASWWLPGGNLQTIAAALWARRTRGTRPAYRRERWATPDGDFVDVDWLVRPTGEAMGMANTQANAAWIDSARSGSSDRDLLVLFHGLEGSSRSHYAESFADLAAARGWDYAVPHFRGCSGELNHAPRAYHSGDFIEIAWLLDRFRAQTTGRLMAVGVSLGGNALLRWVGEAGRMARATVSAVVGICAPLDLAAGGWAIGRGFNRQVYNRMFLNTMKPKAMAKWKQHQGLFDRQAMDAAQDLYTFDKVFTAPVHGFRNTEDYWARASAKPVLASVQVPALVINARNDPFVPAWSLPTARDVSPEVTLWQPAQGGHVGFPSGAPPGHVRALPEQVAQWLQSVASG